MAGALADAGDVDWYQFDVRYDAVQTDDPNAPRHASVAFDIDYADGFARANTNLWVFNAAGQLVLVGGDSDTLDDRPVNSTHLTDDLSRGSVGALDPFIGPVELPAASGLAAGTLLRGRVVQRASPGRVGAIPRPYADQPAGAAGTGELRQPHRRGPYRGHGLLHDGQAPRSPSCSAWTTRSPCSSRRAAS